MSARYAKIATLGDPGPAITCSMDAAQSLNPSSIIPCPSFEEAMELVRRSDGIVGLVPNAYVKISHFYQDDTLVAKECFLRDIPDLVLAGIHLNEPAAVEQAFYQPATEKLLQKIRMRIGRFVPSASNQSTCQETIKSGSATACVTNRLCADHYRLKVFQVLRESAPMGFTVFAKK